MRLFKKYVVFLPLLYSICLSGQVKNLSQVESFDYKELCKQAKINLNERNIQEAIMLATKADSQYVVLTDHHYSKANVILGICYNDVGDPIKSHQCYQTAINEEPDKLAKTFMLLNMVGLGVAAGDTLMAINFFNENFDSIQARFSPLEKAYCYLTIGNILRGCKFTSSKISIQELYNTSFSLYEQNNVYENAGFAALNLSQYYQEIKEDSVEYWLMQAYSMQSKANSPLGMSDVLLGIAQYHGIHNQLDSALFYYNKALPYSIRANYVPFVENNYKGLAEIYEKMHEYELSNKYLRYFYAYKDSLEKENWRSDLSEMQIQYGIKEKNKTITRLTDILKNIKWKIIYSVIGFLIFSVVLHFRLKHHNKKKWLASIRVNSIEKTKPRILNDEKLNLWLQLEKFMTERKVFLDPDLTLISLAQKLKTNRTTLSEVINEKSGKSFNQYINQFRIEESMLLLQNKEKDHLSIEGIAIEVGFKSRSSFYTAFVNSNGDTPSNYRNRQTNEVVELV
nr:AraC family transcriptional regulator [uncultured Carboxylicivirga sp.]